MSLQPGSAATAATLYQQQQLQHLHQLQQLQQLHQQQLAASAGVFHHPGTSAAFDAAALHAAALQQRLSASGSPGAHSSGACSTPASTLTIKEEENDSILGDSFHNQTATTATEEDEEEEDDIDVDDTASVSGSARLPPPAHQQSKQSKPSLAFSISNILSDRFGDKQTKQGDSPSHSASASASAAAAAAAAVSIFRPFEQNRAGAATPSAFTRVDLLEFSRQQQAAAAAATAAMMLERANLLNCFNPAAYPRIHEELVQSRLRRSANVVPNPNAVLPPSAKLSEPSAEKSALGSLCKAVSQIGQAQSTTPVTPSGSSSASHLASPPPASNASTISSSSSSTATSNSSSGASSSSSSASSSSGCSSAASSLNSSPSSRLASGAANNASSPQPIPPPSAVSRDSGMESSDDTRSETGSTTTDGGKNEMWPAWVYCTRYSDRPSSGEKSIGYKM